MPWICLEETLLRKLSYTPYDNSGTINGNRFENIEFIRTELFSWIIDMKRQFSLALVLMFFMSMGMQFETCERIITQVVEDEHIPVSCSLLAPGFQEVGGIDNYFDSYQEAWFLGAYPSDYTSETANQILTMPAEILIGAFSHFSNIGPFESEAALRREYEGSNIRTPCVGIYVFKRDTGYELVRYFRSPGPRLSIAEWEPVSIWD